MNILINISLKYSVMQIENLIFFYSQLSFCFCRTHFFLYFNRRSKNNLYQYRRRSEISLLLVEGPSIMNKVIRNYERSLYCKNRLSKLEAHTLGTLIYLSHFTK